MSCQSAPAKESFHLAQATIYFGLLHSNKDTPHYEVHTYP
ncbi:unnamed protein product, partial [Staurois parvus]